MDKASVSLSDIAYRWALRPVVSVDGGDPTYFKAALEKGVTTITASARAAKGVHDKATTAAKIGLPPDREGGIGIGYVGTCIGTRESEHDLSGLAGHRLRSHRAIAEAKMPLILNRPLDSSYSERAAKGDLRNFLVFDFAINGVAA